MIGAIHRYAFTVSFLCCRMSTIVAAKFPATKPVLANHESVTYVNAAQSKLVDDRLMTAPGFSIDQLMELAGMSVANAVLDYSNMDKLNVNNGAKIAVFCGPGNNGGDGLVAARHLKHFGFRPTVIYPKQGKTPLFVNLVQQMVDLGIPVSDHAPEQKEYDSYTLVVDAVFGFSFQGPTRQPYTDIISTFASSKVPVVSVDIPSGWEVDSGDVHHTNFVPKAVVSLTAPKLCMRNYTGLHFVGGRFVPPKIAEELGITLPDYGASTEQHGILSYGTSFATPAPGAENGEPVNVMFVTASSAEEARRMAQELLRRKLVACVNIVPGIESHYEWEGRLETSQEVLLMIKTRKALVDSVTAAVEELHSYTVPESLALDVTAGSTAYLDWVRTSTRTPVSVSVSAKDGQSSSDVCSGSVSQEASCTAKDVLANTEQGTTDACST